MRLPLKISVRMLLATILLLAVGLAGLRAILHKLDNTIYAKGYNEIEFRRLHAGMTYDEVVGRLGRPLEVEYDEYNNPYILKYTYPVNSNKPHRLK